MLRNLVLGVLSLVVWGASYATRTQVGAVENGLSLDDATIAAGSCFFVGLVAACIAAASLVGGIVVPAIENRVASQTVA